MDESKLASTEKRGGKKLCGKSQEKSGQRIGGLIPICFRASNIVKFCGQALPGLAVVAMNTKQAVQTFRAFPQKALDCKVVIDTNSLSKI